MRYCIPWPYRARKNYHHHDDQNLKDEWQKEVYEYAATLAAENSYQTVIDVGCGSGFKLIQNFGNQDTLGLELDCNLAFLQQRYPEKKWGLCDYSQPPDFRADLVICSDVIEHVTDPDLLLDYLVKLNAQHYVISTPDRALLHKPWQRRYWGPPRNPSHQREWTSREFSHYISDTFVVLDHFITHRDQATQMVVCKLAH